MVVDEKPPKQWSVAPINNSGRANLMSNMNDQNIGEGSEIQTTQGLADMKFNSSGHNSLKHARVQSAGL